jgi:hypothetical protein
VLHIFLALLLIQTPNQSAKPHPNPASKTAKNNPTPDIQDEKPALNFQFNLPLTPEVVPQAISWWKRPSLTDWTMVGLTFSYVLVNVLILLAIKRQAQIAADSLTEFRRQVTSAENQFTKQMFVMSEQAQSTQASAKAAENTSRAILAIERPWVEVQIKGDGVRFILLATNYGRTPAKINHHAIKWEYPVLRPTEKDVRQGTIFTETHTRLLGQSETWEFLTIHLISDPGKDIWERVKSGEIGLVD